MYPLAIVGSNSTADLVALACAAAGISNIRRYRPSNNAITFFLVEIHIVVSRFHFDSLQFGFDFDRFGMDPELISCHLGVALLDFA